MKNYITLYHYSNKDFQGYIKPSYFGNSSFSDNSARISNVKRCYFYIDKDKKEYYFNGAIYCYTARIDKEKLYNLNTDNQGIVKRLKNSQDIHREVKKRGYKGIIGSNGFDCVVLFNNVKITEKKDLYKERR